MKFRNAQNGFTVTKNAPGVYTLIFGAFYFLASGIFIHFFVMILAALACVALLGAPGTLLVILLHLGYAVAASSIVREHYLSRGWMDAEISPNTAAAEPARQPCHWCAEAILPSALVCKHCGREQPQLQPQAAGRGADLPPFTG